MERPIKEQFFKIADLYPIDTNNIEMGQNFTIVLKGEIIGKNLKNNQDGTDNITVLFKANNYDIQTQENE